MVQALSQQTCFDIEHLSDVHIVILTGTETAFCAGGDIRAWVQNLIIFTSLGQ